MPDNIIHAGLIFVVYLAVAIVLYLFFSPAAFAVLDGVAGGAVGTSSESYMNIYKDGIVMAVSMAFAFGVAFPVVWFIFWVFSRDPFEGLMRR
jgi:uncharacterized membrane protein